MKAFIIPLLAALAAGCATGPANDKSPQEAAEVFRAYLAPPNNTGPGKRFLAARKSDAPRLEIAFPALQANDLFLQDTTRDGISTWIGSSGATMSFESGFLRGTRGFGDDVISAYVAQSRAAVLARKDAQTIRQHGYLNGNDEIEIETYRCAVTNEGIVEIDLWEGRAKVLAMQEVCSGEGRNFTNFYWIRPADNKIVQSMQWTSPTLQRLAARFIDQ